MIKAQEKRHPAGHHAGLLLALLLLSNQHVAAQAPKFADPQVPVIRIDASGFDASEADIRAIVSSAGRELWRFFPGYRIEPIVVTR